MSQFADLLIDGHFAAGVATYEDHYPGQEGRANIVLVVSVERQETIEAIVDTGAPWCILDPQIAEQVGSTNDRNAYMPRQGLKIRGITYRGRLQRMWIGLRTDRQGQDLEIEATVFVPTLPPGETWRHPNFIGLSGFLERIRFAVDPEENAFYFGLI
jgi:hypothetical protein